MTKKSPQSLQAVLLIFITVSQAIRTHDANPVYHQWQKPNEYPSNSLKPAVSSPVPHCTYNKPHRLTATHMVNFSVNSSHTFISNFFISHIKKKQKKNRLTLTFDVVWCMIPPRELHTWFQVHSEWRNWASMLHGGEWSYRTLINEDDSSSVKLRYSCKWRHLESVSISEEGGAL